MKQLPSFYILALASAVTLACKDEPKVITAEQKSESNVPSSGIFSEEESIPELTPRMNSGFTEDLHTVVVGEVLPTQKYVYLNVNEGGKTFWIAAAKQDVKVGETYFYRDGLLKTNFESKEYNRVFDSIYLVSKLVAENHANEAGNLKADFSETATKTATKEDIPTHTNEVIEHKGSIKIAELVSDPAAYEGKTVQITGKCVKVNPNIMNRNWIHLKDGSKDDFDLVITSNTFVPEGQIVTMRAEVSLNRDFGAGYRYDLILENGTIIE